MQRSFTTIILLLFSWVIGASALQNHTVDESLFVTHKTDPSSGKLRFYWKDPSGNILGSLGNLKKLLADNGESLAFAMNGGMYLKGQIPQGLYIEDGTLIKDIDSTQNGYGNFYLQPNGIFSLTKTGKAMVTPTNEFKINPDIQYATQSGPMLLIDGSYHPKLIKGSKNLHIRNGVGILPNGGVIFAMSKKKVNFYDLATLFKQNGCKYALYLDGFVSRMYLPDSGHVQLDGKFGVLIGERK